MCTRPALSRPGTRRQLDSGHWISLGGLVICAIVDVVLSRVGAVEGRLDLLHQWLREVVRVPTAATAASLTRDLGAEV